MYSLEKKLYEQLVYLKDNYDLQGIKAEFEAEGSSFRDLIRLRRVTLKAGIKLYLKIGGVEAIRDIKDALEIGVDGLIAPMVESKFGAKKFFDSVNSIYKEHKIYTTLNLETKNSMEQIDEIIEYAQGKFDNITIGRSDLAASYFDKDIKPDSDFTFELLENIGEKVKNVGLTFTVGGNTSSKTIEKINQNYPKLKELIYKLETRKVILSTKTFLDKENAIKEALKFEELYILSKKEFSDIQIASDLLRLNELKKRL
ncbi:aldolase/citrate lyase family protein [Aliarcobacter cryaerophilus]|uniref:aldolase/citrate lyase family protein n=1 Tax=Aliarcobacter cryaerophilus TaxID=28198 RepID=UPI0013DDE85E|nr:aldolase/citrate lyase family protein [Aliarcobacter cryaerophilus]